MMRVVLCLATLLALPSPSEARRPRAKSSPACTRAYQKAVALHESARLIEARKEIAACVKAHCSPALKRKCLKRYTQIKAQIPSVIPEVRDESGRPLRDVEVTMDDEMLTPYTDGRPIQINPGQHEFSFSDEHGVIDKKTVDISPGQRNRRIAVVKR
jgi:hypothetical protein